MTWTQTPPTAPGWYWYEGIAHPTYRPAELCTLLHVAIRGDAMVVQGQALAKYKGYWWPEPVQKPPLRVVKKNKEAV